MGLKIWQVDSFAREPFRGNPAGVCILTEPREDAWMQAVAREMNLSETAFLSRREDGFGLRWFTPAVEVELCGHATLASAHILWETGALPPEAAARFHTKSGLLTAARRGEEIELDFPATPDEPAEPPPGLAEALGTNLKYVGRSRHDYLVEVKSEAIVRGLRPDHARLRTLPVRGVIVTSAAAGAAQTAGAGGRSRVAANSTSPDAPATDCDFVSRFFAPGAGIDEDPVTGSAHCCLAPFWSRRFGRTELVGWQVSARGGIVRVRVEGPRVRLGGRAITVLRGELVNC